MNKDDQKINQKINDDPLISHVRDALDDSVDRIDAETSQKIIAARKNALALNKSKWAPKGISLPKLFTVAATAASIFIAVIIVNSQLNVPHLDSSGETEALELATTQDSIELYEELEFYTWLAEEDVTS